MAQTYINGYFFEYDDRVNSANTMKSAEYKVITDLATEPVTPEFFKLHARIDFEMDDALIPSYLKSARQQLERYSQLSFGVKTIKLLALRLPNEMSLTYGPVTSITDPDGNYTLFGSIIRSDRAVDKAEIEFTTGWGAAGLPEDIKIAICQTAAGLYINRENVITNMNFATVMDQAEKTLDKYGNKFFI